MSACVHVQESECGLLKLVFGARVVVQRCDHETDRNSSMMKALVRANPSYSASALSSLLGLKEKDDNCEWITM